MWRALLRRGGCTQAPPVLRNIPSIFQNSFVLLITKWFLEKLYNGSESEFQCVYCQQRNRSHNCALLLTEKKAFKLKARAFTNNFYIT